jgi:periplasmic protein TonB
MFADYLNECPWDNRSHRGWTTLASFAFQMLAAAGLLLLPLLYMQALPDLRSKILLSVPPPPLGRPIVAHSHPPNVAPSDLHDGRLMTPSEIPRNIANLDERNVPPPPDLSDGFSVEGGTGSSGARNGVWESLGTAVNPLPPAPRPAPSARPPRVSHMMEGNLIHRVQPDYPLLAKQARIQGVVLLRAVIGTDGRIENLQVLRGHPMLVRAAVEAVRQWRYQPYVLNDQPVEVETEITITFTLAGG